MCAVFVPQEFVGNERKRNAFRRLPKIPQRERAVPEENDERLVGWGEGKIRSGLLDRLRFFCGAGQREQSAVLCKQKKTAVGRFADLQGRAGRGGEARGGPEDKVRGHKRALVPRSRILGPNKALAARQNGSKLGRTVCLSCRQAARDLDDGEPFRIDNVEAVIRPHHRLFGVERMGNDLARQDESRESERALLEVIEERGEVQR